MSVTLFRLQRIGIMSFSAANRFLDWLTTYEKSPTLTVESTRPSGIWWLTRQLGNFSLLGAAVITGGLTFTGVILAVEITAKRPELLQVAFRYANAQIDEFELEHGYGCVQWTVTNKDGFPVLHHGGPACNPSETPPVPAPAVTLGRGDGQ